MDISLSIDAASEIRRRGGTAAIDYISPIG